MGSDSHADNRDAWLDQTDVAGSRSPAAPVEQEWLFATARSGHFSGLMDFVPEEPGTELAGSMEVWEL